MSHEYTGIFMYKSTNLSRIRRIFLLYAKIMLIIAICSTYFIIFDNIDKALWILFCIVACMMSYIMVIPIRYLMRNNLKLYS